jgi:4-diphosphocytidyl-2C-methyl-D-erythritol kinase
MDDKQEVETMQKAKEILAADNKPMQEESPLEKAERLNKDTKEMMEQISKDKNEYQSARANDRMTGRGVIVAPPKSQEEQDKENAKAMAKRLLGY